ncbi:uncharacterized protein [Nicotiana tomentosiformis]|uniref:uncharacterized protein n=1 Tax=Nicotiana tomentosiformis TaxID=4098 RepID=UPI00388CAE4A
MGLGKDAVLGPPSGEEEASTFVPKSVKDNKRKRTSTSEDPKSKTRTTRKPSKNIIPLTEESVNCLRDKDEEEEDNVSVLVALVKKTIDASTVAGSVVVCVSPPRTEMDAAGPSDALGLFHEVQQAMNQAPFIEKCVFGLELSCAGMKPTSDGSRKRGTPLDSSSGKGKKKSRTSLQQKLEAIGKLREEVDMIRAETLGWKDGMDRLAAEKETARAQLSSTENQLQRIKEKSSVQARKIEELEAQLASELAKAKSDVEIAKANADAFVAVYRVDAEAAQVQEREAAETAEARAYWVAELAKCQSQRDTLEEIHSRGFDLTEEIKRAKELEADAELLASDDKDDDDGSKSGSRSGEEPYG